MLWRIAIIILLMLPVAAHAEPLETSHIFRAQGEAALKKNKLEEAEKAFDRASKFAKTITDPYDRMNELRYIAQDFAKAKQSRKAIGTFTQAFNASQAIESLPRRLSATIAVVELEKASGYGSSAKRHILRVIEAGLFDEIAASGDAGETGRLIMVLDGHLKPKERARIEERIRQTKTPTFEAKAMHALKQVK